MKCAQCVEEGLTSRVFPGGAFRTSMGWSTFYDESGAYHSHDPNWTTHEFTCSNGHRWGESSIRQCPADGCTWAEDHEKACNERAARCLAAQEARNAQAGVTRTGGDGEAGSVPKA